MPRNNKGLGLCKAKTRVGEPCFNTAEHNSKYCWLHKDVKQKKDKSKQNM